jgi:hypothetical protein
VVLRWGASSCKQVGAIADTDWHRVIITKASGVGTCYLDGTATTMTGTLSGSGTSTGHALQVACNWNGIARTYWFQGRLVDIHIWNSALPASIAKSMTLMGFSGVFGESLSGGANQRVTHWYMDYGGGQGVTVTGAEQGMLDTAVLSASGNTLSTVVGTPHWHTSPSTIVRQWTAA